MARVADGVLIVDKPIGPTSHDVVAGARRLYQTREVGHAGTLDPLASGVLVLMLGEARKLSGYLTRASKTYRALVEVGRATDTLDAEGTTTDSQPVSALSPQAVEQALASERARTLQVPPAFSAIKQDGQRAHRRSRRGEAVVLEPRPVHVERLELLSCEGALISVELSVSKGYYVRSLARDIGERLGLPAHLAGLRRISSGRFTLAEAVAWPASQPVEPMPLVEAASRALPCLRLTAEGERKARLGQRLSAEHFAEPPPTDDGVAAWLGPTGELVALGQRRDAELAVVRGFRQRSES